MRPSEGIDAAAQAAQLQALHADLSLLEQAAQPVPMGLELLKDWSGKRREN